MAGLIGRDSSNRIAKTFAENCSYRLCPSSVTSSQIIPKIYESWGRWRSLSTTASHTILKCSTRCLNSTIRRRHRNIVKLSGEAANKALRRTAIPLRSIVAGELNVGGQETEG